ncbi:unnamed protein product [Anisakis simplex]|uniref:Uncharacterized protein n=1 Tax=Anisakis simplex TaxID=6269 RepID=A0A0M3JDG0_ANISI|nr:unnamed protein product [Anisakis simplex]
MRQQPLAFMVGDSTASFSIQSRRSSDCNAKLSVSLSAEMGQQTPNDSEGTVSATVKPAQNLQMVTRSRARSGPFSVAKVGASSRRSTSKSVDDEVQEITPGVVESKESVESAVCMPAKAQKRSKKATNSVSATAAAATVTLQSTSATSVSESAIKQGSFFIQLLICFIWFGLLELQNDLVLMRKFWCMSLSVCQRLLE